MNEKIITKDMKDKISEIKDLYSNLNLFHKISFWIMLPYHFTRSLFSEMFNNFWKAILRKR